MHTSWNKLFDNGGIFEKMKLLFWNCNYHEEGIGTSKDLDDFALKNKYQLVKTKSGFVEDDWGVYFPLEKGKPYEIGIEHKEISPCKVVNSPELVIQRNGVNEFLSNPHSKYIVNEICPDRVIIYGSQINETVRGFIQGGKQVYVVSDAIKDTSNEKLNKLLPVWKWNGVKLTTAKEAMGGLEWLIE